MSDRDVLSELIFWEFDGGEAEPYEIAGALLAKGVRPPARESTEPDALPVGSVVLRDGKAWQRTSTFWETTGGSARWSAPFGSGPITVLFTPAEEPDRG